MNRSDDGTGDPKQRIMVGAVRSIAWVSEEAFVMVVEAEAPEEDPGRPLDCRAGQFFMVRGWEEEPLLWRPMSVFDWRRVEIERRPAIEVEFLCVVRGRGTATLSRLPAAAQIRLIGPLGNGWPLDAISDGTRVAAVGGGCGAAPLYLAAKHLAGIDVDVFLGFRGTPYQGIADRYAAVASRVVVTSETRASAEAGQSENSFVGRVTDTFDPNGYDIVLACGPRAMLAAIHRQCQQADVPLLVSLEERMACGVGACLGCAVKTKGGVKHVCKDGPVFRGDEVIWDG